MSKIDKILADVNKMFGKGTMLRAAEADSLVVDRIPTGIFDLDMKIGGGIPRGRITMFKGEYSTGKSSVAQKVVVNAQNTCRFCGEMFEWVDLLGEVHEKKCSCGKREPMRVGWFDVEHCYDPVWASKWGVRVEDLILSQPESAEMAVDIFERCLDSQEFDLLVLDSVAALTPILEIESSAMDANVGVMARLMNRALRSWTSRMNAQGLLSKIKTTIILINQMRVGIGPYSGVTSPGGKGLDFFESLEIRFKKKKVLLSKDKPIGNLVEFTIKKNKTAPPSSGGMFNMYLVPVPGKYSIGDTDLDTQVLRAAIAWGAIRRGGAWYYFPDDTKAQGEEKASEILRNNPKMFEELKKMVIARELAWQDTGEGLDTEESDEEESE